LKRQFTSQPVDLSLIPDTAKELILRMPQVFRAEAAGDLKAEIQFNLSGEGGGEMILSISGGECTAREGEALSPALTIISSADLWLKIARREIDPARALMDGLYEVKGDMNLLTRMRDLFRPPTKEKKEKFTPGGEKKMKILAIQGSPRPKTSNTEILLQEFLKGAQSQGAQTETVYLKEKEIHSCVGCYTCWTKTPGVCVFKDDMPELLEKVRNCGILVYATPLHNSNVTALTKAFQERLLPLLDPHLIKVGETYRHPPRYRVDRKIVFISNCGFPEISHFDGVRQVFRHIERNSGAPLIGEILMPAGELLKNEGMREMVQGVLDAAHRAGVEVVRDGRVSKETEAQIQKPIISADELAETANLWWDSYLEGITQGKATQGKIEDIRLLLKGMALLISPK